MRITHLILAVALILGLSLGLSGTAHAGSDFTRSALQMGTSFCPDAVFECDNLSSQRTEIIAAANECVAKRLKFKENVMSEFKSSGEFENCVLSERPYTESGSSSNAVCCIKKGDEGNCQMSCTRYLDRK